MKYVIIYECTLKGGFIMNKTFSFHNDCHIKNRCAKYDTCPMILVHRILSGKWKILILWYLSNETLRFSELK